MRRALPAVLIAAAGALASYGALTAASSPPIASQSNAVTVLRFRQVWDGDRLLPNASVVVQGQRIIAVGTTVDAPKGAREVDLRPLHRHPRPHRSPYPHDLLLGPEPGTTPLGQAAAHARSDGDFAQDNARRTLETGVTTIRDLGASGGADIRDARPHRCGRRSSARGCSSRARAFRPGAEPGRRRKRCAPRAEARVKAGSDWVKVYGSRGSFDSVDTTQTMTFEEMKAIVDAAHALGRRSRSIPTVRPA